ncbi:MAG TPA: hypothetical protein ENK14_07920 [Caldithrix sp.]|nr:hypothetical protein [Caldithrix sp.]
MIFTPEAQCLRRFDFYYSFLPFRNETNGFLFRQAEQFNIDLKAVYTAKHKGNLENERGLLCLNTDRNRPVISAVKKSENDNKLIIRLFNPTARDATGVLAFNDEIQQAEIVNLNEDFQSKLLVKENSIAVKVPFKKIVTLGLQFKQSNPVINNLSSEGKILTTLSSENEDNLDGNLPAIVTKNDILREKKRVEKLKSELLFNQAKLAEVERKIVSNGNEKNLAKLKEEKINIWEKVTMLTRAELEARLSFILTQKNYENLYESDQQKKKGKVKEYDSILRDIGYKLNAARVDKRVAEYIVEFYKS